MNYYHVFEENEAVRERMELSLERIEELVKENDAPAPYKDYFEKTAKFILYMKEIKELVETGKLYELSLDKLQNINHAMYEDILPSHYDSSYANPAYSVKHLGEIYGQMLCFLYTEIRGMIVYVHEGRMEEYTILCELFVEIYNLFEQENLPEPKEVKDALYWFISDYSDITVTYRIREALDVSLNFATDIIMKSDLSDLRYLYYYGEYIGRNEIETAKHLMTLPAEKIVSMAATYTEGYRKGFEVAGIDLSKKKTVNVRFPVGFEAVMREAVKQFKEIGLECVIYRAAVNSINKNKNHRIGYTSTPANKQYDYDHKDDNALYLDSNFNERKLGVLRSAYEEYKQLAAVHAGPAVVETFGEVPFVPSYCEEAYHLTKKQEKLSVAYSNESGQIVNEYIPGDERSFTIIAYPLPEIGDNYPELFEEIVKINTLDYELYAILQQKMIEVLDKGDTVEIEGSGDNQTKLTIQLPPLEDLTTQTNFENCVADVNIPVGEVFTSPKLTGTSGVLHVSEVYLNELKFIDLKITFTDGMISDYSCSNFELDEESRKYIKENIMMNHDTLPMGEFAIGTNTTAYVMAEKYQIGDKLPILIAEKMGPHFAVGDTCYSWAEDSKTYNPDGRQIMAKDNEVSILRKEDVSKAYMNCHTDITIPYKELKELAVVTKDGGRIPIIRDGRFVLEGTEELNRPFAEL